MTLLGIARPLGLHRAVDEVRRLREALAEAAARYADLSRRYAEATTARDAANAKASQLRDAHIRAAEATRKLHAQTAELRELRAFKANATRVGDLRTHPAVVETQPIPVVPSASTSPAEYAPMRLSAAVEAGLL
ncbi:hypothetical protein [Streptomyces goshikiensis]|uniref:hypothetical protein n=1 Tax=Streptomyces goshikiensis TaxID=1942 RepID=UPI0037187473